MDTEAKRQAESNEAEATTANRAQGAEPPIAVAEHAEKRQKTIVRTSIVGIVANVLLAAFKAAVGLAANSIAVVLDAVNNLSDALSSVITIIGARLANRKPDKAHPLGHGRYEYLSAMLISAIVLYAGITSGVESIKKIITPTAPDYSTVALVIIASAVIVKVLLGRYVSAKGKQVNSGSLEASGKDALFDAALSASVLAAALVYVTTGVSLEAYVGVVIAVFIVKAGLDMMKDTLDDILGHRPDPSVSKAIRATICEDPAVLGAYDLLLHDYGPDMVTCEVHVEVPDTMRSDQIDSMTRRLQGSVHEKHGVALTTVGVYSHNTSDNMAAEMRENVTRIALSHKGVLQVHGFYLHEESKTITFDMVIDFDIADRKALFEHVSKEVCNIYPEYKVFPVLDRDLSD